MIYCTTLKEKMVADTILRREKALRRIVSEAPFRVN